MKFEIEKDLLEKVINYLVKQPFIEVAPLLQQLQQLKPIEEKKADRSDESKLKK